MSKRQYDWTITALAVISIVGHTAAPSLLWLVGQAALTVGLAIWWVSR